MTHQEDASDPAVAVCPEKRQDQPDLAIVIPSYKAADTIRASLDSIRSQKIDFRKEIIIVDSSPDDSVSLALKAYPEVTLLRKTHQLPPGLARHEGAMTTRARAILFHDADLILEPGSLQKVWDYFPKGYEIFGGALEMPAGVTSLSAWTEHCFFFHEYQRTRPLSEAKNIPSTLLVCAASTYRRVGSFLSLDRCEDVELIDRMRNEGFKTHFIPDVVGYRAQSVPFWVLFRKAYRFGLAVYGVRYRSPTIIGRLCLGLALPLLMIAKVARIIARNLRFLRGRGRLLSLLLIPAIVLLGFTWMIGMGHSLLLDLAGGRFSLRPGATKDASSALAYITTCFADLSHTFIRRELKALRATGLAIATYGVRRSHNPSAGEVENLLASETLYVYPLQFLSLLRRHIWFLLNSPTRYLTALGCAITCKEHRLIPRLKVIYHFFLAPFLAFEMHSNGIRHIHAHFTNVSATLAMHCARLLGITYSLTIHSAGETDLDSVHGIEDKIHGAQFVVSISRFNLEDFEKHVPCRYKAHVIPCGLELADSPAPVNHIAVSDQARVRLLGIGRIEEKKGFEFLVRACHHLSERGFPFELRIAGDGSLREELQGRVSDLGLGSVVRFLGRCSHAEVSGQLDWSDLCIVPSVTARTGEMEGIPVVLMEAMSAGVPVVATQHSGIPELVIHEQTGLLVPEKDSAALALAIERLSTDVGLRTRCIQGGRQILEDRHDIRKIAQQLRQLFEGSLRVGA